MQQCLYERASMLGLYGFDGPFGPPPPPHPKYLCSLTVAIRIFAFGSQYSKMTLDILFFLKQSVVVSSRSRMFRLYVHRAVWMGQNSSVHFYQRNFIAYLQIAALLGANSCSMWRSVTNNMYFFNFLSCCGSAVFTKFVFMCKTRVSYPHNFFFH
jgi:hypothetical protein